MDHDPPGSVEQCDGDLAEGSVKLVDDSLGSTCLIIEGGYRSDRQTVTWPEVSAWWPSVNT